MPDYTLNSACQTLIDDTRNRWLMQANSLADDIGVMVADDVESIFQGIEDSAGQSEKIYFLVRKDNDRQYGRAILKILHAMPNSKENSWLKLLQIRLEPNLSTIGSAEADQEVYEILALSILESIELLFQENINKLKIYGRTNEMRSMFGPILVNDQLKSTLQSMGLEAKREGAWLVVNKTGTL